MKLTAAAAVIFIFLFVMFWLWQRQPKPQQAISFLGKSPESTFQAQKESDNLQISPQDNLVLTQNLVKFKGKAAADTFVTIYANNLQIVSSTKSGDFAKEVELANGLNLITLTIFNQKLEKGQEKQLTLFVTAESVGNTVFAGSVKSIFDTLVTIATPNGDRNIRTSKSTKIDVPEEKQSTGAAIKNIRVGDYAIALGDSQDKDTLVAQKLQIVRENKPQNSKQFVAGKIITNVRANLFSIKNQANDQIIELTLTKNSQVNIGENQGKTTDIIRDKTALIFYHPDGDKKIVDLVYLIP